MSKKTKAPKKPRISDLSREERRNYYADELARELRFQIAHFPTAFGDPEKIVKIMGKWMRNAKKSKYVRPI